MAGEKYVLGTLDNPTQIAIRNILNPCGYIFQENCFDSVSLMRLIRSYTPDFIVFDMGQSVGELSRTINVVEEEMLCACIAIGDYRDMELSSLLERSKLLSFCPKPVHKELLIHTVEMGLINYRRICDLSHKLKNMTENYETRKAVELAKLVLIERDGISENEAYERIRKRSMDNRLSMKEIAEAILLTNRQKRI